MKVIRKKQESPSSEDKTTADESIKSERYTIPKEIYNDIAVIASASKKTI